MIDLNLFWTLHHNQPHIPLNATNNMEFIFFLISATQYITVSL